MSKKIEITITSELVKAVTLLAEDYSNSTGADGVDHFLQYYLKFEPHLGALLSAVNTLKWQIKPKDTLVEIGSGIGTKCVFSKALWDCNVIGVEPYPNTYSGLARGIKAFATANPKYPYKELNEFGENLSLDSNSVDFLISHEVMEHVANPDAVIAEMYRVLKPGASVFIATCNYDSFYDGHYRFFLPPIKNKAFRRLWVKLHGFNPKFVDEINFITKKTLRNLLLKHNFSQPIFFQDLIPSEEDVVLNVNYPNDFQFHESRIRKVWMQGFIQRPGVARFLSKIDREYKMYLVATKPL